MEFQTCSRDLSQLAAGQVEFQVEKLLREYLYSISISFIHLQREQAHSIVGVPSIKLRTSGLGECFVACTYMIVQFHATRLGVPFTLDYPQFKERCNFLLDGTGLPPHRIPELVRVADTSVESASLGLQVDLLEGLTMNDLEQYVARDQPLILIYDWQFYIRNVPTKDSHCSVLTGYNPINLMVNDDIQGQDTPFERTRFAGAWQRKYNKAIFIHPRQPLVRLDKWQQGNVHTH